MVAIEILHAAIKSLSGTVLMPMLPAKAEFMKSSRMTLAA